MRARSSGRGGVQAHSHKMGRCWWQAGLCVPPVQPVPGRLPDLPCPRHTLRIHGLEPHGRLRVHRHKARMHGGSPFLRHKGAGCLLNGWGTLRYKGESIGQGAHVHARATAQYR